MAELKDKVVLIGMPGCGKTTIGKVLAKELNYNFYDMDDYIVSISGKKVEELFLEGEEVFRNWETRACNELLQKKRTIISTGGGVIKRDINTKILRKNSITIFIDRSPENIIKDVDVKSRPLLKEGAEKIYVLYDERYNLYKNAAHIRVVNDGYIRDILNKIEDSLRNRIKE